MCSCSAPAQTHMPFERPLGYTYIHNPALVLASPPPPAPPVAPSLTDAEFATAKA